MPVSQPKKLKGNKKKRAIRWTGDAGQAGCRHARRSHWSHCELRPDQSGALKGSDDRFGRHQTSDIALESWNGTIKGKRGHFFGSSKLNRSLMDWLSGRDLSPHLAGDPPFVRVLQIARSRGNLGAT